MSSFTKYLTKQSLLAEQQVFSVIAESNYGEISFFPVLDWKVVEREIPERVSLIRSKADKLLSASEGWDQLGIDTFFEWEGVKIALDVTSGSSTVIKNKKKKMEVLKKILPDYKLSVLTVRRNFLYREWEEFLLSIYDCQDVLDHRWV